MSFLSFLRRATKGAALVEYGILVGLIAVLSIIAVLSLGTTVRSTFDSVSSTLSSNINLATTQSTPITSSTPSSAPVSIDTVAFQAVIHPTVSAIVGFSNYGSNTYGSPTSDDGYTTLSVSTHSTNNHLFYIVQGDHIADLSGNGELLTCDNGISLNMDSAAVSLYDAGGNYSYFQFDGFTGPFLVPGSSYSCSVQ